ncbi:MAG: heme o synthase [Xanthomonadales bacterium]|nr:heme o synthase [Xanthomonadales bacterium]
MPISPVSARRSPLLSFFELTKPKVVALIVFTAVVGMLLAVPGMPDVLRFLMATLGIGMAAGAAAAINHLVDQKVDAKMKRTEDRPLPSGELTSRQVLVFALILGAIAMLILYFLVNPLTAVLTFFSLIGYAVIYTMYLKRATPQNIVIGGAAGAAPPLLGWVAMTGQLEADAMLLFLIIYVWTPPHFWALAIHRADDYAKADIPMLPVTHGIEFTRWHIFFYTLLLIIVTTLPYLTGMSGLFYLVGVSVLNLVFLSFSVRMLISDNEELPIKTFVWSIMYLMALFAFLLIDHYLPWKAILHPMA